LAGAAASTTGAGTGAAATAVSLVAFAVTFRATVAFPASCAREDPNDRVTNAVNNIKYIVLLIFIPQTILISEKYKPF
jgi:hypothetical protein